MKRNAILNDGQEFRAFKMAIDQNVLTPEVRANGIGGVDMKRLARSIDQIGEGFKFSNKPKAEDIFDRAICRRNGAHDQAIAFWNWRPNGHGWRNR